MKCANRFLLTDSGDVLFEPKDITLNTNDPILIPFKFILDGVEREQNETFTLEMVYVSGTQSQEAFFTQEIEMVIIDGDIPSEIISIKSSIGLYTQLITTEVASIIGGGLRAVVVGSSKKKEHFFKCIISILQCS